MSALARPRRTSRCRAAFAALALALGLAGAADAAPAIDSGLGDGLDGALAAWAEVWSPGSDLESFDAERLARVYDRKNLTSLDTNAPEGTIIEGFDAYAATWVPYLRWGGHWETLSVEVIDGRVAGDAAWVALRFRATDAPAEVADRTVYDNQATLVLHREDAAWRIVHEHVSTPRDGAAR